MLHVLARIGHTLAETFNYGEGCWDPRDCNQMYRGLFNLNYYLGRGVGTIALKCTGGCPILIMRRGVGTTEIKSKGGGPI